MSSSKKILKSNALKFTYSLPIGTEKEQFVWGKKHYSWKIASDLFLSMFEKNGITGTMLKHPEIYDHPASFEGIFPDNFRKLHLIFRPFEQIRVFKPGYNIGCIAWEFDHLSGNTAGQHPFSHQIRMLSCLDEIWTPSEFSKSVFLGAGITNVHRIPAAIPSPSKAPLANKFSLDLLSFKESVTLNFSHFMSVENNVAISKKTIKPLCQQPALKDIKNKQVFVTVLNPHDRRKNMDAMLKGFSALHADNPNAILLVKCTVDNITTKIENLQCEAIRPLVKNIASMVSSGIVFLTATLSVEEMEEFYRLADFYLCTSSCEGQNLPLLEAMSFGVIPVSVDNTAMADYINDSNSFIIKSEFTPVLDQMATTHWQPNLNWFEADELGVFLAGSIACRAALPNLKRKRAAAKRTIADQYSQKMIYGMALERFKSILRADNIAPLGRATNA